VKSGFVAAAAASLLAAMPAAATTYDLYTSFNGGSSAGQFQFFEFTPLGGGNLLTASSTCAPGLLCLLSSTEPSVGFYKNVTGAPLTAFTTVEVPADTLFFHPGPMLDAGVGFLAPTAGSYHFDLAFSLLSNSLITGVQLTGYRSSGGGLTPIGGIALNSSFRSDGASGDIFMNAGEALVIGINAAGDYHFDSTSISFQVSDVPEPASWAMLIAGFGLTGAVLRRRRAIALTA
jgi:hypothetical protein